MRWQLIRSAKRHTLGLEIRGEDIIIRAPYSATDAEIRAFTDRHADWIELHLEKNREQSRKAEQAGLLSREELQALAEQAARVIPERVAHFAPLVGVSYGTITIRCQKTRWGSCTAAGNLNFNCLLMLAPKEVLDSVVVHELCHRKEMNHSERFYREIDRVFPDYDRCRTWLKINGGALLRRVGT